MNWASYGFHICMMTWVTMCIMSWIMTIARWLTRVIELREETENATTPSLSSKRELCERIQKHVPNFTFIEAAIGKDVDQRNYIVSNKKIEKTSYRPQHSLDDGILELIRACRILRPNAYGNA